MKGVLPLLAFAGLVGCSTLPPTNDPEGCDRVRETAKRSGSDLVVDGDLYCAKDDGDCELTPTKIISSKVGRIDLKTRIQVHILRTEAEAYEVELSKRQDIAMCYPAELWFPSEGHHRGRFYLRSESEGKFHMAYYPRTKD